MKFFFTLIFIFCSTIILVMGQGAEGFNKFRDKSVDYITGSFVGEDGINWDYNQSKLYAPVPDGTNEKSRLELKNDVTAEICSSVLSGGIGLLKIEYSTVLNSPVNFDVFVNSIKVATLSSPASDQVVTISSDNIVVNLDKPFYIRIKQADETSGEVLIDKVIWTKYDSKEFGILAESSPAEQEEPVQDPTPLKEYNLSYHVFPNPAKDFVLVEMADTQTIIMKLYTLAGQMVLQEMVKGSGKKINISNLKQGLYIYKIVDDKGKLITGKLIIR
jgi:hypothetical protein